VDIEVYQKRIIEIPGNRATMYGVCHSGSSGIFLYLSIKEGFPTSGNDKPNNNELLTPETKLREFFILKRG
jgi:hypothetical protein